MVKVLLVDDEKIERESISRLIDWKAHYIDFIGAAPNGVVAYDLITRRQPEIVITDIKMPVVSGLDLIERVKKEFPDITFAVLSGYGDYKFTSRAMLLGVRHYLLKPVTESQILEVLEDVKQELNRKTEERKLFSNLEDNFEKMLPQVKQQFLMDCALTGAHGFKDSDYYKKIFGIEGDTFRIIICSIESKCDFIDKFALKNIAEEILDPVLLDTVDGSDLIFLITGGELGQAVARLSLVKKKYVEYFKLNLSVSVSDENGFDRIHEMYNQAEELLKYRFELKEDAVVTSETLKKLNMDSARDISADLESICIHMKNGDINDLNLSLELFFTRMRKERLPISKVRFYCKTLLKALFPLGGSSLQNDLEDKVRQIDMQEEFDAIRETVKYVANEISGSNIENTAMRNPIVETAIKCVYDNISNPQLNLSWIAKNVLFMNEEYLGRVFLRETKEKFSQYVLKIRIEMAKKLIENADYLKIYEISGMTGFSEDPQYFSRAFKNYTGCTPSEYRKRHEKK